MVHHQCPIKVAFWSIPESLLQACRVPKNDALRAVVVPGFSSAASASSRQCSDVGNIPWPLCVFLCLFLWWKSCHIQACIIYIYIYNYTVHIHTYTHTPMHACMHAYMIIYVYIIHTYIHIYIYIRMYLVYRCAFICI